MVNKDIHVVVVVVVVVVVSLTVGEGRAFKRTDLLISLVVAGGKVNNRKTSDPSENSITSVVSDVKSDSVQGPLFGTCLTQLTQFDSVLLTKG